MSKKEKKTKAAEATEALTAQEPEQEAPEDLLALLAIPGVSGDESAVADWVEAKAAAIAGVTVHRIGDNVIALKGGLPRTAIFAHTDTVGFTLGYKRKLIPVGSPAPKDKEPLRCAEGLTGLLRITEDGWRLKRVRTAEGKRVEPIPGTRWVYDHTPEVKKGAITSPYLDDRAGVWAALQALTRSPNIAVAFCTGEEQHGHGARICADWLYRKHNITQALISDITWHTDDTPNGKGVVISIRDQFSPRQVFLDRVIGLAAESDIPHQAEIQSAGSSDGGHILRSPVPMDWVFIGAPEKVPHTSREQAELSDLNAMADLLTHLVDGL
jgi:putative aminopeptidase FrvX